jgi:hypothetical protein
MIGMTGRTPLRTWKRLGKRDARLRGAGSARNESVTVTVTRHRDKSVTEA